MHYRLGIDLGGTSAKIAIVNSNKKIIKEASVRTAGRPRPADIVSLIASESKRISSSYRIEQAGVGVAGDIDFEHGSVRVSPNLGWKNVPLKKLLSRRLKMKVTVDNDANVAAWGIYNTQAPRRIRHLIVVTLGTGVGGGLILNGAVHRGATGTAGEIGHMVVEKDGRRCNCGNRGCLETYAGGYYMVRYARRRIRDGQRTRLRDDATPLKIDRAARQGDRFAKSLWKTAGRMLGLALGDLIYVFNPQMIYLTGGVAKAGSLILNPVKEELSNRAFKVPIRAADIRIAKESGSIGVVGASLL